jgi:acyl carrier protein phosphodiesterase
MNYLGHLVLAEDNDVSRIGQYLGDFIKGDKAALHKEYPSQIAEGIIAHRKIDVFTDAHPAVRRATNLLKADSGRFSAIIVDVLFDYYLIKHWKEFISEDFESFIHKSYNSLEMIVANEIYPERCRNFTRRLIDNDAFHVYSNIEGIHKVLCGIDRRITRESSLPHAHKHIKINYPKLEQEFLNFFPNVMEYSDKLDY